MTGQINSRIHDALRAAVATEFGETDEHRMVIAVAAVKAIPYGLVREYIAGAAPIPDWVDDVIATATAAVVHKLRPEGSERASR
ncbi:hypothetical protein [Nocardia abscessus]|uniref:hypothetical protein n=1 Tax=Nocardia abscessus TaxID=120957 RepID=UPI0024553BA2|nr:hypothetical protein [Nocardia abscessus]